MRPQGFKPVTLPVYYLRIARKRIGIRGIKNGVRWLKKFSAKKEKKLLKFNGRRGNRTHNHQAANEVK